MSIWKGTEVPTKPWADEAEEKFGWDFVACMNYNHTPEFQPGDIAEVVMLKQGIHDEEDWIWEVTLLDGRRYNVEGGCDYTGWDCRSGATYTLIPAGATA